MRLGSSLTQAFIYLLVAGVLVAYAMGCSNTSYLAKGEKLYTGADISIETKESIPDKGDLQRDLNLLAKPEPNGKFLGLVRLKLWLYNVGIFKKSLGEPPVLLQSVVPDRIVERMRTYLESKGYFWTDVRYTIRDEGSTADIQYSVDIRSPYKINGITVKGDSSMLVEAIRSTMGKTILAAGNQYDVGKLKEERDRIDAALKEKGYFYFSPDFIVFQADTTAGNKTIDLSLQVKKDIPAEATRVYSIGNIYIYSDYSLSRDSVAIPAGDTINVGGYYYIDLDKKFKPQAIIRSVFFKRGVVYSRKNHDLTLNRLMNLGVFKFANIRFIERDSAGVSYLEPHIYLTPLPSKTLRFELDGVSQSNNLAGPVLKSSLRNRNLFGGAELFTLTFEAGVAVPVGGGQSGGNSYEFGSRGELDLPKFVIPFGLENDSSLFVPKTRIGLGVSLLHRLLYYQLFSVDASFSYIWKQSVNTEQSFSPLSIAFAHLTNRTQIFDNLLSSNPFLKNSFNEQFIIGQNYSYTYNNQLEKERKNHLYFKGSIDLSGNLVALGQSLFTKHAATPETPYALFGTPYSEYYKFDIDLRKYFNANDQGASFANRLIVGVGFPYGNSTSLPYVRQFYIGGSNSVRAFVAGGLGPGSYKIPDTVAANSFIDQAGDIKLEANSEYRFPLVSVLKGAVFVDAGNIWLMRADSSRPGSQFSSSRFLNEIAVGTGFGLRVDLSFFILRADLAFPLRVPSLPSGNRWVVSKINVGSASWRKNNLALNIAIGYPF